MEVLGTSCLAFEQHSFLDQNEHDQSYECETYDHTDTEHEEVESIVLGVAEGLREDPVDTGIGVLDGTGGVRICHQCITLEVGIAEDIVQNDDVR